ncbi:MAG: hypothetical protein M1831_003316 [Alyxoria varia]|nr:MAG: hypothetical protein M1831_003316 [Alyxoria varia]
MAQQTKVLPQAGRENILITSALPYVNNVPHLGNIVGSVLSADVFARYCRLRGLPTLFICGTDEYGTATETKALEEKITPQQLCDKYYKLHKEVYDWFDVSFDIFGRTPTQQQTDIAQEIFTKLHKNGYLEERTITQPYCETHSSYLADRFVEGECPYCAYGDARGDQCDACGKLLDPLELKNPRCKLDGTAPVQRDTRHTFILLEKLQPQIQAWVRDSASKGKWSSNGINITESWLKEGLTARCITRDLKWGTAVPLPGYDNKVLYVWFDACIGYVSITANYTPEWQRWWHDPSNVKLYQFMGKDNVPFHSVVFPGSQLGTTDTWTMPHHISTTEYLNYEGGKFSKSRGIGVFGNNAKETGIPPDVWRYYLLSHRPESGDSEFEWKAFIDGNNNVLLKNLGNFVNRIIKFVANTKTYDSVVPSPSSTSTSTSADTDITTDNSTSTTFDPHPWTSKAAAILSTYNADLSAVRLRAGLATALSLSDLGNSLLQANTLDNTLFASNRPKCDGVAHFALNLVHLLSSLIEPYMPGTSHSILSQLNAPALTIPEHGEEWKADSIQAGHTIGKPAYLFQQIKGEKEQEWREQFGGDEAQKAKEEKARKAMKKKEDKARKAAKKQQDGGGGGSGSDGGNKVDGGNDADDKDARAGVDEVTSGVKQASLQPS